VPFKREPQTREPGVVKVRFPAVTDSVPVAEQLPGAETGVPQGAALASVPDMISDPPPIPPISATEATAGAHCRECSLSFMVVVRSMVVVRWQAKR
jgi:hypothetical protein